MRDKGEYLYEVFDINDAGIVSVYDELPLWSSYFGAMLLEKIRYIKNAHILDIGCGTGFPLVEVAQRFGEGSHIYGVEPWTKAVERIKMKLKTMHITNAEILNCTAEVLFFPDRFFDLIVSNVGINNVEDPGRVLSECFRVSKPGAQMVLTVNLPGTMQEFYDAFMNVLENTGLSSELDSVKEHISHKRKTLDENIHLIESHGFEISDIVAQNFNMRFSSGSAMLRHHFIKLAFLDSWKAIVPEVCRQQVFAEVEDMLNRRADTDCGLSLTVPACCFDCRKE